MRLEFFVEDVEKSLWFYEKVMGFSIVASSDDGQYHALKLGENKIAVQDMRSLDTTHPLAQKGIKGLGIEIVLEVEDINKKFNDVKQKYELESELAIRSWGLTDFRLLDPDGYYWRVTSVK